MRLVVKSPVWDDLASIAKKIAEDNPAAAARFIDASEKSFKLLQDFPRIGKVRSFTRPGIRSWRVSGFENYLIFYIPTRDEVQVLAVLHGARELESKIEERL